MVPVPLARFSSALPMIVPVGYKLTPFTTRGLAFMACPGVDDVVSRSPAWIGPFSAAAFTGTTPVMASGTLSAAWPSSAEPPRKPGFVELIPATLVW